MRLDPDECRSRFAAARVARLATTGSDGQPHVVPVTFALTGERIVVGIDQKPKSTTNLRRLRNIEQNPRVAVLADHYDDDWTQLWWVRADGHASVVHDDPDRTRAAAIEPLVAKYEQYAADPPRGPAIVIDVDHWSGWAYTP